MSVLIYSVTCYIPLAIWIFFIWNLLILAKTCSFCSDGEYLTLLVRLLLNYNKSWTYFHFFWPFGGGSERRVHPPKMILLDKTLPSEGIKKNKHLGLWLNLYEILERRIQIILNLHARFSFVHRCSLILFW